MINRNSSCMDRKLLFPTLAAAVVGAMMAMPGLSQEKTEIILQTTEEVIGPVKNPVEVPGGAKPDGPAPKKLSKEEAEAVKLIQQHMQLRFMRQNMTTLRTMAYQHLPKPKEDPKKAGTGSGAQSPGGVPPAMARMMSRRGGRGSGPPQGPPPYPAKEPHKKFEQQVVTGDWVAIGKYLGKLPKKVAPKVYAHLLSALSRNGAPLLDEELLPLINASPTPPTADQLKTLGQIMRMSAAQVDKPTRLFDQIKSGSRYIGGKDPAKKVAAARLLIASGFVLEAKPYLPVLKKTNASPESTNLHALYWLSAYRSDREATSLDRAFRLTRSVLETKDLETKNRTEALNRALQMIPDLPATTRSQWLQHVFAKQKGMGMLILASIAGRLQMTFNDDTNQHIRLQVQSQLNKVVSELLPVRGNDPQWAMAIRLLSDGWMREANLTIGAGNANEMEMDPRMMQQMMMSGGMSPQMQQQMMSRRRGRGDIQPIEAKALLTESPNDAWIDALGTDMADRVQRLVARLASNAGDDKRARGLIQRINRKNAKLAQELASEHIDAWVTRINGGRNQQQEYYGGRFGSPYGPYSSYSRYGGGYGNNDGVPLTRARQVRNLAELHKQIQGFKAAGVWPLDSDSMVSAFAACHSDAEVYRIEDMTNVFGAPENADLKTITAIVSSMRGKLASVWRKPEVQDKSKTKRTDKQLMAELKRGYDLAIQLLADAAKSNTKVDQQVALHTVQGTLDFDYAEFLYGQKVDLKTYTTIRNRAFAHFKKAADLYVASVPTRKTDEYAVEPWVQWFQSALGASDLAYLTRQEKPNATEIEALSQSIRSLEQKTTDAHIGLFAAQMNQRVSRVPPHLKPKYLRQMVKVVGDHKAADDSRKLLQLYKDLLSEVDLFLYLDGDSKVGTEPFGVNVVIRYTDALGRESAGFNKFLLKQTYYSRSNIQHRDELKTAIEETFKDHFTIHTFRYHAEDVTPRRYGRPGWKLTPLVYLVLQAKDPSVDRIPPVQHDLDFNDGNGLVLLPVETQVVLIDAHVGQPSTRPVEKVKVKQTLDARDLAKGTLRLEVDAEAMGLIPTLKTLFDIDGSTPAGFRIKTVDDHGLDVSEIDAKGERIQPKTTRGWIVEYERVPDTKAASSFNFPVAKIAGAEVKRHRYDDADIVEAGPTISIDTSILPIEENAGWIVVVLASISIVAVGGFIYVRRNGKTEQVAAAQYEKPDHLTPFGLISLLERMRADGHLALSGTEQSQISQEIQDLEHHYFAPANGDSTGLNLDTVADRWVSRARR
jgi:hypothetical protein